MAHSRILRSRDPTSTYHAALETQALTARSSSADSSIESHRFHRTPTGRIARARSTSALQLSDANRRAIWEAALNLDFRAGPSDSHSDAGVYPSITASCVAPSIYLSATTAADHFSPRPAYSEPLPSVSEEIIPEDDLFTQYFPTLVEPEDFSSMSVMMQNPYGGYSYANYPASYTTSYSGTEQQQQTVTSSPAPSYPSYVSSPPSSRASPATAHTATTLPRLPSLLTPHYQVQSQYAHSSTASQAQHGQAAYPGYGAHAPSYYSSDPAYAAHSSHYDYSAYHQAQSESQSGYTATQQSSAPAGYYQQHGESSTMASDVAGGARLIPGSSGSDKKPQCWDHGCNGRAFSTFSNLLRHQREKSGTAAKSVCPRCGAKFTRTTARNGHLAHEKCKRRSEGGGRGGDESDAE